MAFVDRCPTCKQRLRRSNPQNALLWLLYHKMAEQLKPNGQKYSAEAYHTYYKSKFLGCQDMTMPNGKTIPIPNSTTELDVAEFSDFFTKVEADAAEHGVFLDDHG